VLTVNHETKKRRFLPPEDKGTKAEKQLRVTKDTLDSYVQDSSESLEELLPLNLGKRPLYVTIENFSCIRPWRSVVL
jgi:hypothetical protein